jgi:hypothetical protein
MSKRKICCNVNCDRCEEKLFIDITIDTSAGNQDWSRLDGQSVCHVCYARYCRKGTFDRIRNKPLLSDERRCTYVGCKSPELDFGFYQISDGKTTGGQDWSSVTGNVLCTLCYNRFKTRGTLKKYMVNAADAKRCVYNECTKPLQSKHFFLISEKKTAGGQDWSSLTGSVLCHACHSRFCKRGTLKRSKKRERVDSDDDDGEVAESCN